MEDNGETGEKDISMYVINAYAWKVIRERKVI